MSPKAGPLRRLCSFLVLLRTFSPSHAATSSAVIQFAFMCWPFLKEGANLSREPPGAAHDESGGGDVAPGLAPPTALGFRKRFMACLQVLNAFSVVRLPLAWPLVVPSLTAWLACSVAHTIVHRFTTTHSLIHRLLLLSHWPGHSSFPDCLLIVHLNTLAASSPPGWALVL
jgi:hypothetical protein